MYLRIEAATLEALASYGLGYSARYSSGFCTSSSCGYGNNQEIHGLGVAAIIVAACSTQNASGAAPESPAVTSSAPPSGSSPAAAARAVSFPAQLLGKDKNTSASAARVSNLEQGYTSPLTLDQEGASTPLTQAVYGDEQNGYFIVTAAKSQKQIASPDNDVNTLRTYWVSEGITDVKVFPAGPSGEAVVCQQTRQKDVFCFWTDHISIGTALYSPGTAFSLNDGASKTIQIRSAVVH